MRTVYLYFDSYEQLCHSKSNVCIHVGVSEPDIPYHAVTFKLVKHEPRYAHERNKPVDRLRRTAQLIRDTCKSIRRIWS